MKAISRKCKEALILCVTMSVPSATLAESPAYAPEVRLRVPRNISHPVFTPRKLRIYNDVSRRALGVDEARKGMRRDNEVIPFTGKGVVIGIVDSGIDPRHVAFLDPATGWNRTLLYTRTYSAHETAGHEFSYRSFDLTEGKKLERRFVDDSSDGHGTHTAGTAAGSDCGNPYSGMAPEASLILTSMGELIGEDEVLFGITTTLDEARNAGMPCVVSLSIGNSAGTHTGRGMLTETLSDELDESGQIVVYAAGNDGANRVSLTHDFDANPTEVATILSKWGGKSPYADVFVRGDRPGMRFALTLVDIGPEQYAEVWRSSWIEMDDLTTEGRDVLVDCGEIQSHFKNPSIIIARNLLETYGVHGVYLSGELPWLDEEEGYTLGLAVDSPEGGIVYFFSDLDCSLNKFGIDGYTAGNSSESISDDCTSPYVLSAGAVNMRESYTDLSGNTYYFDTDNGELGKSVRFSSYGSVPEILPHTMAPGTDVISSLSKTSTYTKVFAQEDSEGDSWYYGVASGTSMATPAISGVIALWLQADPALTRADVLDLLERSGDKSIGGDRSRFGMPSAYEGLKIILSGQSSLLEPGMDASGSNSPDKLMLKYMGDEVEAVVPFPCTGGEYSLYGVDGTLLFGGVFSGNCFRLSTPGAISILTVSTPQGRAVQKVVPAR